jgi:UDP-N-acetylmuramate dehydrogenase
MEEFYSNKSLKDLNTFGIDVNAKYFYEFSSIDEIKFFLKRSAYNDMPRLVLGSGSNILFTEDFQGLVFHPLIKGIAKLKETKDYVFVKSGAGENWDDFVNYCVSNNIGGLENLSLIPGTVGAAPVQNIGAYGVEVKDYIYEVETINIDNCEIEYFTKESCNFDYRDSVFKNKLKNKYIVLNVVFKFSKIHCPVTNYGNIEIELNKLKSRKINDLRDLIINIRKSKLPDPAIIGNAGSFFKNPVIECSLSESLQKKFPSIPCFNVKNGKTKISAGWLIEKCGWKGKKINSAGVFDKQALVIVNYGIATGKEIMKLSEEIQKSVFNEFGIKLEPEVNII